MNVQDKKVLKFKVQSFRRIPNPYAKSSDGEKNAEMAIVICDVKDVPDNIPTETNPREQKMTTSVARMIKESLLNTGEMNFYLLNRGLLLSAKSVSYNNYSNEVTIEFEDPEVHGNVDGGHTYRTIIENRNTLDYGQQFVKIEILTGIEGFFQSLAAARNKSVPVQDKSIAELENRFDLIKNTLARESYMERISFKENDSGEIDVADLLAILNMFNIDRYVGKDSFPTNSYSSKKKCIDLYIEDHEKYENPDQNPYVKMKAIMPDIFRLYDAIEVGMNGFYIQKNPGGRYGSVKGVQKKELKTGKGDNVFHSKFLQNEMEASSPNGFIYPILGAFRALVEKKEDGRYGWMQDPFAILKEVGPDLVDSTVSMSRSLGNNPQSAGKDTNLWKTLYMTVALAALA